MHIILLRGLAREAAHWMQFPEQLRNSLGDGYRIHCIDFPGCGIHYQQAALTSIPAMSDYARAQFSLLTINDPVLVIGISMGGMVALDWAQRFPETLTGVVLINSSAGHQPLHWRLRPGVWPAMIAALLLPMPWRENLVLRKVSNNREHFTTNLQHWLDIQALRPVSRTTILTMLIAAARFRPQTSCIQKGLVIASNGDQFVSCKASSALAEGFHWPLIKHPTAGHDIPMDEPDWLCATIRNWLQTR